MGDRIEGIGRISYNACRVEPVRNYTAEEGSIKIRGIKLAEAKRVAILSFLAKYPNPNHLSFPELLDRANNTYLLKYYTSDYILDIGNHDDSDTSDVIVDIGNHSF